MQTRARNVSLEDLQEIVGAENAREATADDAVDGVEARFVAEPGSVEEISGVLKLADREGMTVAPKGGGTKMGLGNPPRSADLVLGMSRMNALIEHAPGDQVVRVEAGIKLDDLQETLADSDQMLGVDPPEDGGATVGGVIAANASGPRRLRYGTIRDLIIGITVVLADGTIAKAGGKVVKNVAGYDLSKLFTGSLGTLGVIATANFRLHPRPETARAVIVRPPDTLSAGKAAQEIMHAQIVTSALELRWDEEAKLLAALIEGIPPAVEAQSDSARYLLKGFGEVDVLSGEEADALPGTPRLDDGAVEVKVSAPPAELSGVLDSVLGACSRRGVTPGVTGHAATGVTAVVLSGGGEDDRVEVVEELREIWTRRGGSVVVRRAPLSVKQRLDAWGPAGDYVGLMRRVKEKFDPGGILNPGRFVGGI